MKNIFIGPSVRNGGSLINRLFDHHSQVAAYPMELILPMDSALHPSLSDRGQRRNIQNFPNLSAALEFDQMLSLALADVDESKCMFGRAFDSGLLAAKTTHITVKSHFDHRKFIEDLRGSVKPGCGVGEFYNNLHKKFFEYWDEGEHVGSGEFVAYHSGNGLMADLDIYFSEFDGYFIQPIRSIRGVLASEKKKCLRQLLGRGLIGRRIKTSDRMLKMLGGRIVENIIVNWLIVLTRATLLKRKYGDRYIIYRHEDLVQNPEPIMRQICGQLKMQFEGALEIPTIAGEVWGGNSMYGPAKGLDESLSIIRDVFTNSEERLIEKYTSAAEDFLAGYSGKLIELSEISDDALFDHAWQYKIFDSRAETALYLSSMYERWKYQPLFAGLLDRIMHRTKPVYLEL